jgi:hypothetical protein
MKVLTIGDLHGKTIWNKLPFDEFDHVVFIGDYLDGDGSTDEIKNLNEIIRLKIANPEKFKLLIGNHEVQYYWHPESSLKKYNQLLSSSFHDIFEENEGLFDVAFQVNNYLWTHAGITNRWLQFVENTCPGFKINFEHAAANALNSLLKSDKKDVLFSVGKAKGGNSTGGPFRADISELKTGIPLNINQIIGHFRVKGIEKLEIDKNEIILTDCLNFSSEWAVLDPFSRILSVFR